MIAAVDIATPYKGLAPFEDSELDALLFFGRERESELVAMNIMAARLTVLYGPTGVGKSSLLRAGVARRLRDLAPGADVVLFSSWRDDPVAALRELIAPGSDGSLADAVAGRDDDLYLVLDQFEEYFLYHGHARDESTLVAQLPELVNSDLRVNVLLGIREDSLAKLDAFKARLPRLFGNYLRLDHLDRNAGRDAILGPLARYGELSGVEWGAQPELVEAVLEEVAAGKIDIGGSGQTVVSPGRRRLVEAPFLQLVLQRLWELEHARGSTTLTLETLRALGGAERIVEDHLERAMGTLTPSEQDAAAVMFDHLVTPSGSKIAHRLSDLATYASLDTAALQPVVGALEHERILRPLRDGTNGDGSYEIYHDVLAEAVRLWRQRYQAQRELQLERQRAHHRNRRMLAALAVVGAGLAAMTAIAIYALTQRTEARRQATLARSRQVEIATQNDELEAALAGLKLEKKKADRARDHARAAQRASVANLQRAVKGERSALEAESGLRVALAEAQAARDDQAAARGDAEEARDEAEAAREDAESERTKAVAARHDAESERTKAVAARAQAEAHARNEQRLAGKYKRQVEETKRANVALRRTSRTEKAGRLVARAETLLDRDPHESMRLGLNAARLERDPRVADVLRRALFKLRLRAVIPSGGREVEKVAYSPDGRLLGVASDVGGVRVLRTRDFKLLQRLKSPGATTLAFDPRGSLIASGSRDGTIRVWDISTGALLQTLSLGAASASLEFSPDGRMLLAGGGSSVRRWDTATFIELPRLGLAALVRGALFSPDGRYILTFTAANTAAARVYDAGSGERFATLTPSSDVSAAAWSPTGDTVTTASARNVSIWDAKTWERRHLLSHGASVAGFAYHPDGSRVVSVGSDGNGRIWSTQTGELLSTIGAQRNRLVSVAYARNGLVATGSRDQTARIWVVVGAAGIFTLLAGHTDTVSSLKFSPDATNLVSGGADGDARVWSTAGDPQLVVIDRHDGGVTSVAASHNGSRVVSGGTDGVARIWNRRGATVTLPHGGKEVFATFDSKQQRVLTWGDDGYARLWGLGGAPLAEFRHGAAVTAAVISPKGDLVATVGVDGFVRTWSAAGGARWFSKPSATLVGVAVSPDGSILATAAANGALQLWNARTGALRARFEGDQSHSARITDLAFSPRGRRLATGSRDGTVRIWNVPGRTLEREIPVSDLGVSSVEFSPDGKRLVTADREGDGMIWTVATGLRFARLPEHGTVLQDARYSADGRWILTSAATAAALWDGRTGEFISFLRGHTGPFQTALFSGDGRYIFTGGQADGTVRRYGCGYCAPQAALEKIAKTKLAAITRASRNAAG